jgi:hypothetical protein
MPITRRTILKALGIAPAIVAGAATVEAVEADPTTETCRQNEWCYGDGCLTEADVCVLPRYDAGFKPFDKLVDMYSHSDEFRLHRYRITSTGVEDLGPVAPVVD